MSKDNEKEIVEKKTTAKTETKEEKVVEKKENGKEKKEVKKEESTKRDVGKKVETKKETSKKLEEKDKKTKKEPKEEVVIQDSQIREKVMILGSYLLEKIKEYRYVIGLDIVVFLLLFFLIPQVIFDVKPFIWMLAFVVFTVLPTIGLYGMNKFRDKQIMFSFFFIYILILIFLKRFTIIELYGITSQGSLDHTPAWLDAVFITCIIVFFQYLGILVVNLVRRFKKKNTKKSKKEEK